MHALSRDHLKYLGSDNDFETASTQAYILKLRFHVRTGEVKAPRQTLPCPQPVQLLVHIFFFNLVRTRNVAWIGHDKKKTEKNVPISRLNDRALQLRATTLVGEM